MQFNSTAGEVLRLFYDSDIDGVVRSAKQLMMHFNAENYPRRHLSFTKDQLYNNLVVYYFPKKSVLRNLFNNRIRIFLQSGLSEFWYTQNMYTSSEVPKESAQSPLHFKNIIGILQICAPMYLITCIVFHLEVISVLFPRIKYITDYLNY